MGSVWPDIPFEESMIESGVIVHCPVEDLARDLFKILKDNGVEWAGGESMDNTRWDDSNVCYRITPSKRIRRGDIYCYDDSEYDVYTKCTFYGADTEDFDISEDEFLALLEAGGE